MQTFLPYPDIVKSLEVLDNRRLGKQRVEAFQILNCLRDIREGNPNAWKHHPAVLMWEDYEDLLTLYYNESISQWIQRGYQNNMQKLPNVLKVSYPWWFGREEFHSSHRSNLLRKDFNYYSQFGWKESPDLPYWWPTNNLMEGKCHNV